jgi:putative hydrolase of the HAD superfamily
MDDTLYLERDYVRSGFLAVDGWLATNCGIEGFFHQAWRFFEIGARGTIFNRVLEIHGIYDPVIIKKLVDVYRRHKPNIGLSPDARRFLIKHNKETLALITDGPAVSQWAKIKALNLENHVDKLIVTEELGLGCCKPNIKPFLLAQEGFDPDTCIYIGDNPSKDFQGPKNLNWRQSVRIRREGSLHYNQLTPIDCVEISSFDELTEKILGINWVKDTPTPFLQTVSEDR